MAYSEKVRAKKALLGNVSDPQVKATLQALARGEKPAHKAPGTNARLQQAAREKAAERRSRVMRRQVEDEPTQAEQA